ncbi:hypothetical protein ABFS82_03G113600 [Erythranthe guttata]|uniref:uncharacterized protein LOC105974236 n=1 Tax=Erythranthe guttata TaxID=4155 RepID=UPI00064D79B2|nr:PREDICTED: uncharacterized protein LOC105974236 [Erythranthe guttata]|eukprot:XP_012854758.1 PREDICTED: uncharacterized protein LOC105974236 [Erythranthe guttata]
MADRLNIILKSSREITPSVTPEAVWRAAKPESTADVEIPEDVNSFSREAIIAKLDGNPNYFVRNQYERLRILPRSPDVGIVRIDGITQVVRLELGLAALLIESPIDLETAYLNAAQQEEDDSQNNEDELNGNLNDGVGDGPEVQAIQQDPIEEDLIDEAAAPGWNFGALCSVAGQGVIILERIWVLDRYFKVAKHFRNQWVSYFEGGA